MNPALAETKTHAFQIAWRDGTIRHRMKEALRTGTFSKSLALYNFFILKIEDVCRYPQDDDTIITELANYFAALSQQYPQLAASIKDKQALRVSRRAIQVNRMLLNLPGAIPVARPWTYLDVGCGNGHVTAGVARALKMRPRYDDVIGLDVLPFPVPAGITFTPYAAGDAFPLEKESIDLATIFTVLHHADDPVQLLQETRRVLRPGAVCLVREFHSPMSSDYFFNYAMDLLYTGVYNPGDMRPGEHYKAMSTWHKLFIKAGFEVVHIRRLEETNPFKPFMALLRKAGA